MNFDPWSLFVSLVFGAVGFGFFRFGKKQGRFLMLTSGLILMVYPYFVSNIIWMVVVGVILIVLPFLIGV